MSKKKKNRRKPGMMRQKSKSINTVRYLCSKCGAEEEIPEHVLEYFDEINPEQLLFGTHQFTCEECGTGIMKPENEPEIIVKGYGLFEGLGFDFKS
jgi:predicted nucleic acid-binding Zn ribbon protein